MGAALGLATVDQLPPFQCSVRLTYGAPELFFWSPTAKQSVALEHDRSRISANDPAANFGAATIDQLVPFHCSTRYPPF